MKICILIRSLGMGGAERQCLLTAVNLSAAHEVTLVTFYDLKTLDDQYDLSDYPGLKLVSLSKQGRWDIVNFAWRYLRFIKIFEPDVVYAYLNTACLLSAITKLVCLDVELVWSLRSSDVRMENYGFGEKILRKLECWFSPVAKVVISNSWAGKDIAISQGYRNRNIVVIPNGIDTERFQYSQSVRRHLREQLGIDNNLFVLGVVARHDPMKGLEVLLGAYRIFTESNPDSRLLIIGKECAGYTQMLKQKCRDLGLGGLVVWLPAANNIQDYYSVFDLYVSSSIYGEGFSNSVGEAMSTGVACLVTDVGDSAKIVDNLGCLKPPESVQELAEGMLRMSNRLALKGESLSKSCRAFTKDHYSIEKMVLATDQVLRQCRLDANEKI